MHLSDLLLEKLNSDAELFKRVQLAKNVFISADLRIAYKEEYILTWFLKMILEAKNEEEKKELIKGFCFCVDSNTMAILPASGVRASAKTNISKYLTKILKLMPKSDSDLIDSVFMILKKFSLHYKSHSKQYVKVIGALLSVNPTNSQFAEVLNLSSDIFKSGALHEKFVMHLLEKDFHMLFVNLDGTAWKDNILVQFIQKMFFKKEILSQFQMAFHMLCSGHDTVISNPIIQALIYSLHTLYTSNVDVNVKAQAFCKVFQSFVISCGNEESAAILQCFIIMCHLLGLEQMVHFQQSSRDESPKSVVNEKYFKELFEVSSIESNETSFTIVKSLIETLSSHCVNLNTSMMDSTYQQWFQSFILAVVGMEHLSSAHLKFFSACADLDTYIIEKNFTKIFSRLLCHSMRTFENEEFAKSFGLFMENSLQMHSKLQRIQKFILKLLQSIRNCQSSLTLKNVLSDNFINEFSSMVTFLPSMQALSFMDDLLNSLDSHCVKILEDNTGPINVLLIQVNCALLAAFLCGVRVLSHMTPQGTLKSFIEKVQQLKDILGRFGKALLVRIHDREIVQPFLNLCFYWGEFELLIMYYSEEHAQPIANKDISPTDLSCVHSYLNGEEWNVLAERVSNFGAVHCYQLFLKLILQKLRTLQLKKCHTLINGEATSIYILTQLTSELYKHNIIEELTPQDLNFLLSHLTQVQSRLLLDKLYTQIMELGESEKLIAWMVDSMLLENPNFVTLSIVVILQKIGSKLNTKKHNGAPGIPYSALCLDFVDENYNVNQNEFVKLVEHLNELLQEAPVIVVNDVKIAQMRALISVLKCLPLVYMPPEISSLSLSGLTFLAVIFSNVEEFLRPLVVLMYDLMVKCSRRHSLSCFNIGLCIKWLLEIKTEDIQTVRNNMIKLLLRSGVNTDNGLDELKQLIKFMKKRKLEEDSNSLEHQILLYQDLGKSWPKSKKRTKANDEISKYRKKLSKRIRKELEKQNELESPTVDCDLLVTAYGIELTRAVRMKNEENLIGLIQLNFDKFFDIAVSKVREGSKEEGYVTFLTTVLMHMPHIKDHLHKNTLKKIWNALKTHSKVDWKLVYKVADDQEFEFFLLDLLKIWRIFALGKNNKINLEAYFGIWMEFYCSEKNNRKLLYEKYLKRLFVQFSAGMASMENFAPDQMIHLFGFVRFCISTHEVVMTSSMLDSSFDIIYNYNMKETWSVKDFQTVFESSVNAASWLLTARSIRIKDKIHNVFQLFTKLLDTLVRRSSVTFDITEEDLLALSSCSHNMEKWTSKMVKYSKDFSRVSVYFIAALVSSFVRINIYPAVKAPLVNCINNFLSISDSHNVAHLVRVLNPGSQQVFNGIYETYKKYYKFTGKV